MVLTHIPEQHLPYSFVGPASIPTKQHINNGYTEVQGGTPFKPDTMTQGSEYARARKIYSKDAGGGQNWFSSSQHLELKKINAIGKASRRLVSNVDLATGYKTPPMMSFRSQEKNSRKSALARVRGGGAVAPKKKGALANPFKSG